MIILDVCNIYIKNQIMIYGILLILLGLLAVPSLILSKKPDAGKYFDKLAPYQGWIGLVFAVIGIFGLVKCLLHIGTFADAPIAWITWLATTFTEAALGFILGYGLIKKYALKKEKAAAKGEKVLGKLLPLQGTLGIIAIILGIWSVVAWLIW